MKLRLTASALALGVATASVAVAVVVAGSGAANAEVGPTVGTTAAPYTPWLSASTSGQNVRKLVQCGSTMYAVGKISDVNQGSSNYHRGNGLSFSTTDGSVARWDPQLNGPVSSIALSPDCSTAYLGGQFTRSWSSSVRNVVAVNTSTGQPRRGFPPKCERSRVDGPVHPRPRAHRRLLHQHQRRLAVAAGQPRTRGPARSRAGPDLASPGRLRQEPRHPGLQLPGQPRRTRC